MDKAAYNRAYREAHREELMAYRRAWYRRNRERIIASTKDVLTPAMHAAHQRVYKALRSGEITRPSACSMCGRAGFVEAAHENYAERLAIRWLCRPCHRAWDAKHPKASHEVYQKPERTHCPSGHALTPDNVYLYRNHRQCRTCRAAAQASRRKGAA